MKPIAFTIVGLLVVAIVGLLAWPHVHNARVRASSKYQEGISNCQLIETLGDHRSADACRERINRKHGLTQ